jgi:hypothetical protein
VARNQSARSSSELEKYIIKVFNIVRNNPDTFALFHKIIGLNFIVVLDGSALKPLLGKAEQTNSANIAPPNINTMNDRNTIELQDVVRETTICDTERKVFHDKNTQQVISGQTQRSQRTQTVDNAHSQQKILDSKEIQAPILLSSNEIIVSQNVVVDRDVVS